MRWRAIDVPSANLVPRPLRPRVMAMLQLSAKYYTRARLQASSCIVPCMCTSAAISTQPKQLTCIAWQATL